MKVLAIDPYYGGSHQAFLTGWSSRSQHDWTILGLPAHNWKWRMRHSTITLSEQVNARVARGESWDVLFATDMLNLAEFLGLVHPSVRLLPSIAYFHENQLTYPVREQREYDYHFAFTNFTTALAANRVWFNSRFHCTSFLKALEDFLSRMPDYQSLESVGVIRKKSEVWPQGIDSFPARGKRKPGPMRILWAARWEHDKNPQTFFDAIEQAARKGVEFRISVIGQSFRKVPEIFEYARGKLAARIDRWGYQASREDYVSALLESDVFVSTAIHEFFGISAAEAINAGCFPLLPRRLAYPELLKSNEDTSQYFYDGSPDELVGRLERLARSGAFVANTARKSASRFLWDSLVPRLDAELTR